MGFLSRGMASLLLAGSMASCASGPYFEDRAKDLADCFTLRLSAGPELSADLKLADAVHLAVGGGVHGEIGLDGRRVGSAGVMTLGLPVAPFLEDGVLYGRYLFTETSGTWNRESVEDECYLIHAWNHPPTHPDHTWVRAWDVEVGATLLIGARAGIRFGEVADFFAGIFGFDPAADDTAG
ncbi:MAG: hypothetical protein ACPG31_06315 [Planctomycetota bacterium]